MPLLAHLTDLRKSLVRAFVWVLLGFCVCYIKSETIYEFLARPILQELKNRKQHKNWNFIFICKAYR